MFTLQAIKDILTKFSQTMEGCRAKTRPTYDRTLARAREQATQRMLQLRDSMPDLLQLNLDDNMTDAEAARMAADIRRRVQQQGWPRYVMDPNQKVSDLLGETLFETPCLVEPGRSINFENDAQMTDFLLNLLLVLPVGSVRFFVVSSLFQHEEYRNHVLLNAIGDIHPVQLITTGDQFQTLFESLKQRFLDRKKTAADKPDSAVHDIVVFYGFKAEDVPSQKQFLELVGWGSSINAHFYFSGYMLDVERYAYQ